MIERSSNPASLQPQELEAVYAISRAVSGATSSDEALNQIVRILRPVFIFDNAVLYQHRENDVFEPSFAKAIGRGRFREADLTWGELTAQEAYQTQRICTRMEELNGANLDRTNLRYSLGLPVKHSEELMGALVFVRFGGPEFTQDQIHLVEFVAVHIAQLLRHHQLVEQVASLEARRRLDALQDDFIATISHELLTPLGFIKGYATTLLREDINWDSATRHEFLTIIDEESDRLRGLIDNLMDSSRLQAGTLQMTFQLVRMDAMLKEISLRSRSHNENLVIELIIRSPGLEIQADPTRLVQVFDNIMSNATKYAPGSPITITLEQIRNQACISIRDYGPGISPDHLKKIFQRFYRVPGQNVTVRGTGLGLYICRKIIQAHGGEIQADSKEGEGTTFFLYLPCEDQNRTD